MLTADRLSFLLEPYVVGLDLPQGVYDRCAEYLNLLLRWNGRTNLTAVRDPEQLATRQLGESLFAARSVQKSGTLLDFGSGAGFPGIPLQLAHPALKVTLAESQGKKVAFLREAVRTLELGCEIWPARVEDMPLNRRFDVVTMRAVDRSDSMAAVAAERVADDGLLLRFEGTGSRVDGLTGWAAVEYHSLPGSEGRLTCLKRQSVFHVEHS